MKKMNFKRGVLLLLLVSLALSLVGCTEPKPGGLGTSTAPVQTDDPEEYLIEEDGEQFLILPISKVKVRVRKEYAQYLNEIDYDLLRTAEETISAKVAQYSNHSGFYLQVDDGHLCLYTEVIVSIDPPESSEEGDSGCGIDHEHQFFCERISK